jgi:pimeloyl-ACP methyl ester carboxylesterase
MRPTLWAGPVGYGQHVRMAEPDQTPTRPATTAAAASLALDYADRLVVGTARDVHHAVGRRAFTAAGPAAAPAARVHGRISRGVYAVVGAGLRAAGAMLRAADRRGRGGPDVGGHRVGRRMTSVVNGLVGESLDDAAHPLAIRMAARVHGRDVSDLAAAYPDAGGDVVVFVHGLAEDDESWRWCGEPGGPTYADRLRADTSWTPVTLRYNTGLPVARNGRLLSEWLTGLLREWPVPVRRVALVGHSMGGLVALSACEHGAARDGAAAPWTSHVRHVVCLGTPHLGAPLERFVHWGSAALSAFPESSPFATVLDTRSAGIADLRDAAPQTTPLPGASYHCFSGSLNGPLGLLVGDLLVRRGSATGRIPGATSRHLPGTHHFRLLNHPEVYADLRRRLDTPEDDRRHDIARAAST